MFLHVFHKSFVKRQKEQSCDVTGFKFELSSQKSPSKTCSTAPFCRRKTISSVEPGLIVPHIFFFNRRKRKNVLRVKENKIFPFYFCCKNEINKFQKTKHTLSTSWGMVILKIKTGKCLRLKFVFHSLFNDALE